MKSFIYITLLLIISILSRDEVILCSDDGFKDEQCMKKEKLGSNTFKWVKKCKGAQVCVDLPYYGGIIGACSIKVRSHYDRESCANDNKCTSGVCDGTKCKGKTQHQNCQPGLGQCKKGLLCRKHNSTSTYPSCQPAIANGQDCTYAINRAYFDEPALNPCVLDNVCDGTCKLIGSVDAGIEVLNPLACKSGYGKKDDPDTPTKYTCVTLNDQTSDSDKEELITSKGAIIKTDKNLTDMFDAWKKEVSDSKKLDDEDAIYEAYRYTRNKKKVNKAWFIYTHYGEVYDTDDCTFDYLWKQNNGNTLKYSLMIFALILLF